MQDDKSGASTHHDDEGAGEVLTPAEVRGQAFKRLIRAAAASQGLFDDAALARRLGRSRMTLLGWWRGAKPEPPALEQISEVTGLSLDELAAHVYFEGPAPSLPPVDAAADEAAAWGRQALERPDPNESPGTSPRPRRAGQP